MTREEFDDMDDSEALECINALEEIIDRMANRIDHLSTAIEVTILKNRHLADGDDCTLIHLVRAIGWKPPEYES
jgi:hypothetical protein